MTGDQNDPPIRGQGKAVALKYLAAAVEAILRDAFQKRLVDAEHPGDGAGIGPVDAVLVLSPQPASFALFIVRLAGRDEALVLPHVADLAQCRPAGGHVAEVAPYSKRDQRTRRHATRP